MDLRMSASNHKGFHKNIKYPAFYVTQYHKPLVKSTHGQFVFFTYLDRTLISLDSKSLDQNGMYPCNIQKWIHDLNLRIFKP